MSFPRYPAYKPSGVEWLGDVPSHWDTCSLRHCLQDIFNGITSNQIDETPSSVPVTRIETISSGSIDESRLGFIELAYAREDRKLRFGDILFSNINSLNMIGNCAQYCGGRDIYAGMNLLVLRPAPSCHPAWLFWLVRSATFRQVVESLAKPAINQASISQGSINTIGVPVPVPQEQQEIAVFLEREVAKLNVLVAEQQRLVALLKEKRKAVISHAVTKGLDPDASMKPSGVEWLGDVPSHWRILPIRRVVTSAVANGIFKKRDEFGAGNLLVNVFDIYRADFKVNYESLERVACTGSEEDQYEVRENDLLVVRSSLTADGIGAVAVVGRPPERVVFECHLIRVRPHPEILEARFGSYLLNSPIWRAAMVANAKITTMTTVDQDAILSTPLVLPNLSEQTAISRYLDARIAELDALTAEAERAIDLLQERRTALISAAVTGQIDVRQAV